MAIPKIHQTIAVLKGLKTEAEKVLTQAYHLLQKPALLSGLSKTYEPRSEDGDRLPGEGQRVQATVPAIVDTIRQPFARLFDEEFALDLANCAARADVVVDGKVLIKDAPVTYLMFLDKQLTNLATFVSKWPTLDTAKEWHAGAQAGVWQTPPVLTVRTDKVPERFVKSEATDKHPAQVEILYLDKPVGTWTKIDFSGAIPVGEGVAVLNRVRALQEAVKVAIQVANATDAPPQKVGAALLTYLFG